MNPALSSNAYKWRSWAKQRLGDYTGALKDINTAISMQPTEAKYFAVKADLRKKMNDTRGALEDYSLALQLAKTQTDSLVFQELHDSCLIQETTKGKDSLVKSKTNK